MLQIRASRQLVWSSVIFPSLLLLKIHTMLRLLTDGQSEPPWMWYAQHSTLVSPAISFTTCTQVSLVE